MFIFRRTDRFRPDVYMSEYFCPLCGDDTGTYDIYNKPIIEICIPCKRIIIKKYVFFLERIEQKQKIKKYFNDIVVYELLTVSLHPSRCSFFLEYDSFWNQIK